MLEQILQKGDEIYDLDFSTGQGGATKQEVECFRPGSFKMKRVRRHGFLWKDKETSYEEVDGFRFLPWVPQNIGYCDSEGLDVLSGVFSGCIMARYKRRDIGSWRVCHVATGDPNDCKETWDTLKEDHVEAADVSEFLPHKPNGSKTGCSENFGLITNTGELFSIACKPHRVQLPNPHTRESLEAIDGITEQAIREILARRYEDHIGLRVEKIIKVT